MPEDRYGFDAADWDEAKREAKEILGNCAKNRRPISYSDFVRQIRAVQLDPHDVRLGPLLGEISSEESRDGRGMLAALVVHKTGNQQPGPGFFELAQLLGHNVDDREEFWIQEFERVCDAWKA